MVLHLVISYFSVTGVVCPFCHSDWQFFGVSCYLLSPSATTWQESAHWCRIQGGHLAVVRNLKEQVGAILRLLIQR